MGRTFLSQLCLMIPAREAPSKRSRSIRWCLTMLGCRPNPGWQSMRKRHTREAPLRSPTGRRFAGRYRLPTIAHPGRGVAVAGGRAMSERRTSSEIHNAPGGGFLLTSPYRRCTAACAAARMAASAFRWSGANRVASLACTASTAARKRAQPSVSPLRHPKPSLNVAAPCGWPPASSVAIRLRTA